MEFGLFIQGYVSGPAAHDPEKEHEALLREAELVQCADKNNFKFAWLSEHHALPEYSHLSSSETLAGYLAATTDRIHIGSAIFNISPRVNHPVRNAERVAMLDHLTNRRFEFGTGRGAGSHEVGTFNIHDTSSTRSEYDEVLPEIVRMWEQRDYKFQGKHFQLDNPHNILPKPYAPGHPPIWVACGNPPTFEKAGRLGIGALAFTFESAKEMDYRFNQYREGISNCTEPVGQFVNENIMMTSQVWCASTREKARAQITRYGFGYSITMVSLYHDTFPHLPHVFPAKWPYPPPVISPEMADEMIAGNRIFCGTPDEVCEQMSKAKVGNIDQITFATSSESTHEEKLEMIELVGQKVIPEFDKDLTTISTDLYRAKAVQKHPTYNVQPPPLETIWTRGEHS
jgi:alkanesulfonate monooxygenase SsuD/methylene tetrahydromethanopterin reductase-like flavin-dependent oxidoreductase (luciferase family)